jgi:arylsulfatase
MKISNWIQRAGLWMFFGLLVAAATNVHAQRNSVPKTKPNILVLYADDWRHDTLGVAGNLVVKTPRLDWLAQQAMRFRRAYVTTSICGVSRATLFTGQWMSR